MRPSARASVTVSTSTTGVTRVGDETDGLIDRHHRPAEGKAIVGQLRHVALISSQLRISPARPRAISPISASSPPPPRYRRDGRSGSVVSTAVSVAMPTMPGSSGNSSGFSVRGAIDLDLAVRLALETLDDDEIDRRHLRQQFRQSRLGARRAVRASAPSAGWRTPKLRPHRPRDASRNPCRARRHRRRDGRA